MNYSRPNILDDGEARSAVVDINRCVASYRLVEFAATKDREDNALIEDVLRQLVNDTPGPTLDADIFSEPVAPQWPRESRGPTALLGAETNRGLGLARNTKLENDEMLKRMLVEVDYKAASAAQWSKDMVGGLETADIRWVDAQCEDEYYDLGDMTWNLVPFDRSEKMIGDYLRQARYREPDASNDRDDYADIVEVLERRCSSTKHSCAYAARFPEVGVVGYVALATKVIELLTLKALTCLARESVRSLFDVTRLCLATGSSSKCVCCLLRAQYVYSISHPYNRVRNVETAVSDDDEGRSPAKAVRCLRLLDSSKSSSIGAVTPKMDYFSNTVERVGAGVKSIFKDPVSDYVIIKTVDGWTPVRRP